MPNLPYHYRCMVEDDSIEFCIENTEVYNEGVDELRERYFKQSNIELKLRGQAPRKKSTKGSLCCVWLSHGKPTGYLDYDLLENRNMLQIKNLYFENVSMHNIIHSLRQLAIYHSKYNALSWDVNVNIPTSVWVANNIGLLPYWHTLKWTYSNSESNISNNSTKFAHILAQHPELKFIKKDDETDIQRTKDVYYKYIKLMLTLYSDFTYHLPGNMLTTNLIHNEFCKFIDSNRSVILHDTDSDIYYIMNYESLETIPKVLIIYFDPSKHLHVSSMRYRLSTRINEGINKFLNVLEKQKFNMIFHKVSPMMRDILLTHGADWIMTTYVNSLNTIRLYESFRPAQLTNMKFPIETDWYNEV